MKYISILLGLVVLLGAGCSNTGQQNQAQSSDRQIKCEQSGGLYTNDVCTCQEDEYADASDYTYNTETGYCEGADGTPGGELGKEFRKNLEQEMQNGITKNGIGKQCMSNNDCSSGLTCILDTSSDTKKGVCATSCISSSDENTCADQGQGCFLLEGLSGDNVWACVNDNTMLP